MTEPTLGGVAASQDNEPKRFSGLLWAPAGSGKTTLAMTMPGRKALINFDPDGPASIPLSVLTAENDSKVFDLSSQPDSFFARMKDADMLGLEKVIDQFDSIIVDSLTTLTERALARGVTLNATAKATLERPTPSAYMVRNNLTINFIRSILQITGKHNKHVLFIAHEGAPLSNDDGAHIGYTMSLGGQLPNQAALRINEVWYMFENSKNEKLLLVRKARLREPVKSRMFDTTTSAEFQWRFNPTKWDDKQNMRIDRWYQHWVDGGYNKIPQPK